MSDRLKDIALSDYIGTSVEFKALLKDARVGDMKKGGSFLTLQVMDGTSVAEVTKFNVDPTAVSQYTLGGIYHFEADVRRYEAGINGLSLVMTECHIEQGENSDDYLAWEVGTNEAYNILVEASNNIASTVLGRVVNTAMGRYFNKFSSLPAAVSMHHVSNGGLMVHTASVLTLSERIADFYTEWYPDSKINRTLLIAGAILHDIGKVVEYDLGGGAVGAVYAGAGVLTPHIISGIGIVSGIATELGVYDTSQVQELLHLIASHHGRAEWGSPVEPHTIEADILSNADMLDSTISRRIILNKDEPAGEGKSKRQGGQKFATYVSVLDPNDTHI